MGSIFGGGGGSHTTKIEYRTDPKLEAQIQDLQQQLLKLSGELVDEKNKRINGLNDALADKNAAIQKLQAEMNKKLDEVKKSNEQNQQKLTNELTGLRADHADAIKQMTVQELERRLQDLISFRDETQSDYINNLHHLYKQQIVYDQLNCNIKYEEKKLIKFNYEINDRNVLQLLLYSPTGHGKSTFANRLFGDRSYDGNEGPFQVSDDVDSETQNIQKGMNISLV